MKHGLMILIPLSAFLASLFPVFAQDTIQVSLAAELSVQQPESVAWSPDGNTLAVQSGDGIYLYDLGDLELVSKVIQGNFLAMTYKPDGTLMALQNRYSGMVELIDLQSGDRLIKLKLQTEFIASPVFNQDGTLLAFGDEQYHIQLWDLVNGELLGILDGYEAPPTLAFSPDSRFLASGGGTGDHSIFLWDLSTFSPLWVLSGGTTGIDLPAEMLAFSPNGQWLVAGTSHGPPLVRWNMAEPETAAEVLIGGLGSVFEADFSPNSLMLAIAYSPPTPLTPYVSVIDMVTGDTLIEWTFDEGLAHLAFNTDGTLLAIVDYEHNRVQLWEVELLSVAGTSTPRRASSPLRSPPSTGST